MHTGKLLYSKLELKISLQKGFIYAYYQKFYTTHTTQIVIIEQLYLQKLQNCKVFLKKVLKYITE